MMTGCSSFKSNMFLKVTQGKADQPKSIINVPFTYSSYHTMVVHPLLNNYQCHFIFDTGGVTMIDNKLADSLKITDIKTLMKTNNFAKVSETNLNGLIVTDLYYPMNSFSATFKVSDQPIYGMIGSNFLRFFNTTINYQNQMISFQACEKLTQTEGTHLNKMKLIPPYLPTIKGAFNGESYAGLVDTGLSYPFVFPLSAMENLNASQKTKLVKADGYFLRWPFTTSKDNYYYRADQITIGDIVVKDVLVFFADLPPMIDDNTFLIGKFFLENYTTTLNFKYKQVLFKDSVASPNDIGYSFGLNLVVLGDKYTITGIWKNSPADLAGLKTTSIVTEINGQTPDKMELYKVSELLYNKNIPEIELTIMENSVEKKIILKKEKLK